MTKILIVEDEKPIANLIDWNLSASGYSCTRAYDGLTAADLIAEHSYDLVLLDIMLPELSGLEVLRRLRRESDVPVIMLTARDAVMDKVSGLDAGADDYITKPFAIEELLARIRVILRKKDRGTKETRRLCVKGVTMDIDRHEVTFDGESIELNHREYELVRTLMENKNIVMNREQLLRAVCGYDYMGESNVIDVYVRYIRSKIDERFGIRFITTVRGVGYAIKED